MVASRQQAQTKMVMAARASVPTNARLLMIQCMRCVLLIRGVDGYRGSGSQPVLLWRQICGLAACERWEAGGDR